MNAILRKLTVLCLVLVLAGSSWACHCTGSKDSGSSDDKKACESKEKSSDEKKADTEKSESTETEKSTEKAAG